MHLSDAKEQVYRPAAADRNAWAALDWTTMDIAKELGVLHRRRRARPAITEAMRA